MSEPDYKGRALLPMPVIEAARAGDVEAVEALLPALHQGHVCGSAERGYRRYGGMSAL